MSNNNSNSRRANLNTRVTNIRRNYSRLLSNRNTFNSTPAQWNALGNQSRAAIRYIVNHNLTNYAVDAGFGDELRRMIARSNARNPNARANSNNSGSNNNARANSNNNATRVGGWRGPPPGVRANALARARELVGAEANHRRTLNTRLANLQRRYNRLIDPSFTGAGVVQWNSLGNGAESLYQYILNHNLVGYARGTRINRLQNISAAANSYGPEYISNNNNAGSNNNRALAAWIGGRMNIAAGKFERNTKWNVNAKNNAQAWYSNKKVKLMNTNVIRNLLDGRVFRPTDVNNLYFDANNRLVDHG